MVKVLITGASGQLGAALCRRLGAAAVGLERSELDITDASVVQAAIADLRPDVFINTAGYTAVDRAESDREACYAANATGVAILAGACERHNSRLVQISTDYVFGQDASRRTPYRETDVPGPQGVYAHSKLAGERRAATCPRHLIVRTCGLYGPRVPGSRSTNFVETMLRLAGERNVIRVVDDQRCTPSYVDDVAAAIEFLVHSSAEGVYHVVNGGSATWYEFAAEIFQIAGNPSVKLEPISTAQYAAPAPRPAYSVLDTAKYRGLGGPPLPDWHDALARYLAQRPRPATAERDLAARRRPSPEGLS